MEPRMISGALLPDSPVSLRSMGGSRHFAGKKTREPSMVMVYMQCYFVTIATILGTGILGLPVTLSHAGLYPFMISFFLGFFAQVLCVYFFTDILQRAYAVQVQSAKEKGPEHVPLNEIDLDDDFDDLEEEHETDGPVMAGHIIIPKDLSVTPPNLHLLGQLFLPCGLQQMFDVVLFVQFIALLISYALAGSEAFAQVIGVDHFYVIPVFVWFLTFAVVFALRIIQPIVSILTFAKGTLLLGTVIVTFFVGASINNEISNDFTYLGAPFLMGTVALGGIVNVMPFLYQKIKPVPKQVSRFRFSIICGLITCTILNVLWCWAVLDIVPQTNQCFTYQVRHNNSMHAAMGHPVAESEIPLKAVCTYNLSLESAQENGEISTIPLTQIIHTLYPSYDWVALLVQLFIMISITVSFLTIGAAMHHTISGWVESLWSKDRVTNYVGRMKSSRRCFCMTTECLCRTLLSLFAFALVFTVAMLNPRGFEEMLEKAASLFINLEAGVFVFIMIRKANSPENSRLRIPLPLSQVVYHMQYLIPIYFCFAVIYDILTSIYSIVYQGAPLPWEYVESNGIIFPIDDMYFNDSIGLGHGGNMSMMHDMIPELITSNLLATTESTATTVKNIVTSLLDLPMDNSTSGV